MTPPETLVGAKCRCATVSVDDRSEKFNEKVINPCCIVISKLPVPAVLIGGTSFAPLRLAEKRSVCEGSAEATSTLAVSTAIAQNPIFLIFILFLLYFMRFHARSATFVLKFNHARYRIEKVPIVNFRSVSSLFPTIADRLGLNASETLDLFRRGAGERNLVGLLRIRFAKRRR